MPPKHAPKIQVRNAAETEEKRPELLLYGDVGYDWSGFTDVEVAEALKALGKVPEIGVRVNSLGGDIGVGLAVYNLLRANGAKIYVHVDGYACSSAATICMAGDEIEMGAGAVMMIHKPTCFAYGESSELRKQADVLDLLQDQIAGIYSARSGKTKDEMNRLMDAETWLTGEEAMNLGLCTSVVAGNGPGSPEDEPVDDDDDGDGDDDDDGRDNRFQRSRALCRIPAGRFRNAPARLLQKSAPPPANDPRGPWRRNLAKRRLELLAKQG